MSDPDEIPRLHESSAASVFGSPSTQLGMPETTPIRRSQPKFAKCGETATETQKRPKMRDKPLAFERPSAIWASTVRSRERFVETPQSWAGTSGSGR
jgi:hypothetical protein